MVPLSVTSRAVFMVENNGFSDMEVSYRLPQHCPVDIAVSFPEGRQVRALMPTFFAFCRVRIAQLLRLRAAASGQVRLWEAR